MWQRRAALTAQDRQVFARRQDVTEGFGYKSDHLRCRLALTLRTVSTKRAILWFIKTMVVT